MLKAKLKAHSSALLQNNLHRTRQVTSLSKHALLFSSNDYLSLTNEPSIKNAYQTGFKRYPVGSGGSMLVCGYHPIHQELEKAFARALSVDDALIFSSGYAANISMLRMLSQIDAHVFIDKLVHASIYDGLQDSRVQYTRYLHNDLCDLTKKMTGASAESIVLTESLFSMSGQIAPLAEIASLKKTLLIDEAHAFGVLGRAGLGGVIEANLTQNEVPLRIIPLGKACGATGAIVAGDAVWIDTLLQTARPYIYSTAMSPAVAYGVLKTLEIVQKSDERRVKLNQLVRYFRDAIQSSKYIWRESYSPIQQLQLGCPALALSMASYLKKHEIICLPMRQPTVSKQETGLRIILNYEHEPHDIDILLKCLHEYTSL